MTGDQPGIAWQPQAPEDLHERIDPAWHGRVADILIRLKADPKMGERLTVDERTGDLSDCRKIKFGPDHGKGPAYRLVYRLLPDSYAPTRVEIVAVGPRRDLVAYALAAARLDRDQQDDR